MHKELNQEVYRYRHYLIQHLRNIYMQDILNDLREIQKIKQKEFNRLSTIDKFFYIYKEVEYLHREIERLCKKMNI